MSSFGGDGVQVNDISIPSGTKSLNLYRHKRQRRRKSDCQLVVCQIVRRDKLYA